MIYRGRQNISKLFAAIVLASALCLCGNAWGQAAEEFDDFSELTLEEMLNQTVTSATKMEQSLMDSPNAISIVTAEDIRKAGVRTVPEALALAPGVYVSRMSDTQWVVTIGGFALNNYSNKLLVLVDGVSVYSPLVGGVDWSQIAVNVDEIARIEIIRGPGGVLYGANATNGVVNIITFEADAEGHNYVNTRIGTQGVREGNGGVSLVSDDGRGAARLSINYEESNGLGRDNGDEVNDGHQSYVVSARTRYDLGNGVRLSLDGRYKAGEYDFPYITVTQPETRRSLDRGVARFRVDQDLGEDGQWYLQAFHWRSILREEVGNAWQDYEDASITDVEFQQLIPFEALGRHNFIYGGGYRWIEDEMALLQDGEQYCFVANAYIHDEWIMSDQFRLDLGVKWEHTSLVDPTWQWRGAMIWQPNDRHAFRVSASNSYRSPSILEDSLGIRTPLPAALGFLLPGWPAGQPQALVLVNGNSSLDPENILAYEFGYHGIWFDRMNVDLTYGYKEYDNLISLVLVDPGFFVLGPNPAPPPVNVPYGPFGSTYGHSGDGEATSHTVEVAVDTRLNEVLRFTANYSHVDIDVDGDDTYSGYESNSPRNMARIGLSYADQNGFMWDAWTLYHDEVKIDNAVNATADPIEIDAYWRIDARIAQRFNLANGDLEIGAVGQNLGQEWHEEYSDYGAEVPPHEVRRSYYGYVEYLFK